MNTTSLKNQISQKLNEIHNQVSFDPSQHKYFVNNIEFFPVTSCIEYYTGTFDKEGTALRLSKGEQQQAQILIKQWEQKSTEAKSLGSLIHLFIEADIKNNHNTKNQTLSEIKKSFPQALYMLLKYSKLKDFLASKPHISIIAAEQRVFHPKARIAGTIDCLLFDEINQCLHILDWKTNQHFDKKAYSNLLHELSYMPANHLSKYSVQLSTYKQILSLHDLPTKNMYIIHLGGQYDTLSIYQCIDFHKIINPYKMECYANPQNH